MAVELLAEGFGGSRVWAWLADHWSGTPLGVAGLLLGAVGVALTAYYSREAKRNRAELERMQSLQRRLDWNDVEVAANETASWIKKREIKIDVIVAPGVRGAMYAQRIANNLPVAPPIVVGITRPTDANGKVFENSTVIGTNDWSVEFPGDMSEISTKSILVVDDYARGGSFMQNLKDDLLLSGFQEDALRFVVLVATRQASDKRRIDYAWYNYQDDNFRFPWGRAI